MKSARAHYLGDAPLRGKRDHKPWAHRLPAWNVLFKKCWVETWNHQAFLTLETPAMRQHFLYWQFIFKFADGLKKVNPVLFSKLHLPRVHAWHIYSAVICAWKAFAVFFLGGGGGFEGFQDLSRGHCWKNLSGYRKLTCVKSLICFLIWALPRINLIKLFKSSWFLICRYAQHLLGREPSQRCRNCRSLAAARTNAAGPWPSRQGFGATQMEFIPDPLNRFCEKDWHIGENLSCFHRFCIVIIFNIYLFRQGMQHNLPSETSGFVTNSKLHLVKDWSILDYQVQKCLYFLVFVAFNLDVASCIRSKKRKKKRGPVVWYCQFGKQNLDVHPDWYFSDLDPWRSRETDSSDAEKVSSAFPAFLEGSTQKRKVQRVFWIGWVVVTVAGTTSWWASKAPPPIQPMHTKWPLWPRPCRSEKCAADLWQRREKMPWAAMVQVEVSLARLGFIQPGKQVAIIEVLAH